MRSLIILCITLPLPALSQENAKKEPVDSIRYYQKELQQLQKRFYDSMRNSEEYAHAIERIKNYVPHSDNYGALMIYGDIAFTNYDKFNSTIVPNGFKALKGQIFRFGIGGTVKTGTSIVDFSLATFGFNNKTKKGDESIKTSLFNALQVDFGYDFMKSQTVNIYPYAGLSFRMATMEYSKPVQVNGSFTNITNIIQNDQSVISASNKLGYQAGIGFEFVLNTIRKGKGGTILFAKTGINRPIGKETFHIEGVKYRPDITFGQWIATIGFKFFTRT